jgi:hypothetical protein
MADTPGVMPLARKLGEALGVSEQIPELEPIPTYQFRPSRKHMWPPEVWAEMQAIYNGEKP